ncbi:DSS1/SEM1 family-domain-containing protein [Coniella lustricola]|uniref:26S proteasome complex subunit SEM1 n=1 Tax=Coniella lustricola TaxID=2025994 RepID=A0A2T3ANK0_9PEZI|nr:DSS1/SEM1 family-domain-containing protein [Coniella lustricola]
MASAAPQQASQSATSNEAGKPIADETTKRIALEEDDEFEDFPVEDWPAEDTEAANSGETTKHLWEESWDDDDTSDDFSKQLKEEHKKVEASKRR